MDAKTILDIVMAEQDDVKALPTNETAWKSDILEKLSSPDKVPLYGHTSSQLSLVRFQCLLQDTGYPMEVYLPPGAEGEGEAEWGNLQERWVGWATEIPGQQAWTKKEGGLDGQMESLSVRDRPPLPSSLESKHALPNKGDYLGAVIKVYDEVNFKPASMIEIIGLLSTSAMPASSNPDDEDEDPILVPCIHALLPPRPVSFVTSEVEPSLSSSAVRNDLLKYLSTAFEPPDLLGAEYLLLLLISSPTARPTGLPPLGTLSLNLLRPKASSSKLQTVLSSVSPVVVDLPLSLENLHSSSFQPSSPDSTKLNAGRLQLGDGTVLIIEEDAMGEGGRLEEKAVKNLKALAGCLTDQRLGYEYPYMGGLKMDCALRGLVLSEGKSLLPVDVQLPLLQSVDVEEKITGPTEPELQSYRSYLQTHASSSHAAKLSIPDDISSLIQESFVTNRKLQSGDVNAAEGRLKRQMRIARLLALSHDQTTLDREVWDHAVEMDKKAEARMMARSESKMPSTS